MSEVKSISERVNDTEVSELSSDMIVIGPGKILSEARINLGLSQQDIATRLKFHLSLVENIENENFDKNLPDTYNRGYLRNFAKIVNVSQEDILNSYEMLGVAEEQYAEMQSFSQETKKQAEHSRIMWMSYLIITVLIALTVYWFIQDRVLVEQQNSVTFIEKQASNTVVNNVTHQKTVKSENLIESEVIDTVNENTFVQKESEQEKIDKVNDTATRVEDKITKELDIDSSQTLESSTPVLSTTQETSNSIVLDTTFEQIETAPTIEDFGIKKSVQFIFSGDCWVNIYDATGERVAWGVKKEGYVMNFKGYSPFKVTLGRPELVSITYQNDTVSLSQFKAGNIAKFSLPLATNY